VFPQPPNGELAVEIMTPHHGAYYEGKDSPHDAGQPNPIPFLALPAGSKLRFVITFEPALWPADLAGAEWQPIVERTLAHAFEWVGFGAKTAVGYGAMREDEDSRRRRENAAAEQRAAKEAAEAARRRATLPPEEAELDERRADLERFAHALDTVRGGRYQKGGPFDQERKAFLEKALSWQHRLARTKAAALLRESYKLTDWPAKKERKAEVKAWLARLDGNP
jgi:CRISPR-associated protein Cmr6